VDEDAEKTASLMRGEIAIVEPGLGAEEISGQSRNFREDFRDRRQAPEPERRPVYRDRPFARGELDGCRPVMPTSASGEADLTKSR
jgi:hypothetical protein